MVDTWWMWGLLLGASFLGGGLNAIAGGGSFFTLPALVYAGFPAVVANASGTLSLFPGYIASTWGFREDLRGPHTLPIYQLVIASGVGGGIGASLLLITPDALFRDLVPWLLLIATAVFAFGPWVLQRLNRLEGEAHPRVQFVVLTVVSTYGGYFNGGVGILLLATLAVLGHEDLNRMNGLKNLISAVLTAIAVGLYAAGGAIAWTQSIAMMGSAVAGGYVAARIARRLPPLAVRVVVVITGVIMTVLFFR